MVIRGGWTAQVFGIVYIGTGTKILPLFQHCRLAIALHLPSSGSFTESRNQVMIQASLYRAMLIPQHSFNHWVPLLLKK